MTALTKETIKALRAADSVVARFETDANGSVVGAHLDLGKEIERGDGFGRETLHVAIPTQARVENYGGHSEHKPEWALGRAKRGDWVILYLSVKPEWVTFASLVREGDQLCQRWTVDNRSQVLKEAGITMHELAIEVQRSAANGRVKVFRFMLDASAHRANSSAEPITRAPA